MEWKMVGRARLEAENLPRKLLEAGARRVAVGVGRSGLLYR